MRQPIIGVITDIFLILCVFCLGFFAIGLIAVALRLVLVGH